MKTKTHNSKNIISFIAWSILDLFRICDLNINWKFAHLRASIIAGVNDIKRYRDIADEKLRAINKRPLNEERIFATYILLLIVTVTSILLFVNNIYVALSSCLNLAIITTWFVRKLTIRSIFKKYSDTLNNLTDKYIINTSSSEKKFASKLIKRANDRIILKETIAAKTPTQSAIESSTLTIPKEFNQKQIVRFIYFLTNNGHLKCNNHLVELIGNSDNSKIYDLLEIKLHSKRGSIRSYMTKDEIKNANYNIAEQSYNDTDKSREREAILKEFFITLFSKPYSITDQDNAFRALAHFSIKLNKKK